MNVVTLPCGCAHIAGEWIELCAKHWREHIDQRAQWAERYRLAQVPTTAALGAAEGLV